MCESISKLSKKNTKNIFTDFFDELSKNITCTEEEKATIKTAFDKCIEAHKEQERDTWWDYAYHPIRSALIISNFPDTTVIMVIKTLMHDVIEDTPETVETLTAQLWKEVAASSKRLAKKDWFDEIQNIPKDKLEEGEKEYITNLLNKTSLTPEEKKNNIKENAKNIQTLATKIRDKEYYAGLNEDDIILKIAERIDNLNTMKNMPWEKKQRKIEETHKYLLPLCNKIEDIERRSFLQSIIKKKIKDFCNEWKIKKPLSAEPWKAPQQVSIETQEEVTGTQEKVIKVLENSVAIIKRFSWEIQTTTRNILGT